MTAHVLQESFRLLSRILEVLGPWRCKCATDEAGPHGRDPDDSRRRQQRRMPSLSWKTSGFCLSQAECCQKYDRT